MKTFISNLIRVGFRSILARFIILFVSISLLIQTINFLTYNVYLHYVESELERNYDRSLSNVAVSLNKLFEGIYQSNFLLSLDSSVMKVFSADFSIDELPKYADISQSVRSLARVKYGNASIDSAYILKRDNQLIISNEGTYEESYFYGNVYPMEKYPIEYWQQYSANHDLFQILPPSRITGSNRNQNKTILPVVQSKIAEYASDNLYVIHLNAQYMTDLLRDYRLTPGSMIFIADRNRNMLASTEANFTNDGELQQFLQAALSEPADKFKGTYKGKK